MWQAVRIYGTAFVEDHDVNPTIAPIESVPIARDRMRSNKGAWRRDDFPEY
jgi:hypothetical protein